MNTLSACQFDKFRLSSRECDHPALLHFVWSPFTLSDIPFSCSSQAPGPDSVRQLEYQVNLACAGFPSSTFGCVSEPIVVLEYD